ncbi:MAG TPA: hypothetical protein DCZ92_10855 [Elusimicrobia bacterium]|nr:MAG: hypothetical protein A2016_08005 [Elusimicrobia bacterium GWF2_62_30]HBA61292.1 hypothetical protein [Elusimicrobiota bacterium]
MEIIQTTEVRALVDLQKMDTHGDALAARAAAVPVKIAALEAAFEEKKNSMTAAKDALVALQVKKKDLELKIAEAEERIRKHQRDLNAVKENNAFKALLSEIETCQKERDGFETEVLLLMEEVDKAAAVDKTMKGEIKGIEDKKNAEAAVLEAEKKALDAEIAQAAALRAAAAAAITPALVEKYEHLRGRRAGLAIACVHEDPATGKFSCGGCHMSLTPQKMVDVKKKDAFALCADCRRMIFLERTVYG